MDTIKKIFSLIGAISLGGTLMLSAGCTDAGITGTQSETPTQQTTEDQSALLPSWRYAFNSDGSEGYTYEYTDYFVPFWTRNIIKNEIACFVKEEDGIIARLMFKPEKIISVRDWSLKKELKEGVDYTYDEQTNTLRWIEGSKTPYFTHNLLSGRDENGEYLPEFDGSQEYGRFDDAFYSTGKPLYGKQIQITYTYNTEDFTGPVCAFQGEKLQRTIEKLMKGEDLTVAFYGDSIPYGCEASSLYNREPKLPIYPKIVAEALRTIYGSNITYKNYSRGGVTSQWGVENLKRVLKYNPDIIIILLGGNDVGLGSAEVTMQNTEQMIKGIKDAMPNTDIILMGTIVENAAGGFNKADLVPKLTEGFEALAAKYQGVAAVDIYNLHEYMLTNKNYIDLSGNGVNHPNDFLIRVHAQQLLSALVDFEGIKNAE